MCVSLQLHRADPKPEDAMDFINKHLTGPVNADEFSSMKENLSKLTEDMETMKSDLNKIQDLVKKILPEQPSTVEEKSNTNESLNSMENNVGDASYIPALSDDSSLIFEQTLMDASQLDANMYVDEHNDSTEIDGENTSQVKEELDGSTEGYTMEIVELDVVDTKGSLDTTIATANDDSKAEEDMQFDDIDAESGQTSTPEPVSVHDGTDDKLADTGVSDMDVKIEQMPIYLKEEDCEEM